MPAAIKEAINIDYKSILMGIILISFAIKSLMDQYDYFCKRFGIKTRKVLAQEEAQKKQDAAFKDIAALTAAVQELRDGLVDQNERTILIALAREQLIKHYNAAVENGFLTYDQHKEWLGLYDAYHELGGNGTVEAVKNQFEEIELRQ